MAIYSKCEVKIRWTSLCKTISSGCGSLPWQALNNVALFLTNYTGSFSRKHDEEKPELHGDVPAHLTSDFDASQPL